jgi:eukaryotic-like serine/threonine-protein kinase
VADVEQSGRAPPDDRLRPGSLSALIEELVGAPDGATGSGWTGALHPGAVIGRFELVRELGRGGFGVVYEARDTVLGRLVAFKAVHACGRPDVREEQLLREAEAAARLSHPNIVTLHDVGRSDHGPYLVLELLRGKTLAERLEQGPVTIREAVRIGVEVTRGLAHAHAQGVIHRDLTPGNVFLCDDGQVKVLDLGMAHAFGRRKLEGGTPAYMAPEQWRGAPEDERTDVFALGVILHRLVAGELPYPEDGGPLSSRPAPVLDVPDAPALGELLARMLSRDPVERPRDAAEVLSALTSFEQELARAPSSGRMPPARARRPSRWRIASLVAVGVVLGAAVAALVTHRRASVLSTVPSVAVLPFADLSAQKDQEYFSEGLSEEILNALAHLDGLHVTGRSSAYAFKNRGDDLRAIGEKLNVGAVLEGSVRKAGNRVRVTAQLIDIGNGYQLWSESFDRDLADIFAVQDEIARAVVAALRLKLLPGQAPSTTSHRTRNTAAYNEYLLGRQFYARFTEDGARRAMGAYQKALALDPGYAPAWSALAIQLSNIAGYEETPAAAAATLQRALQAAERSIALAPDLAEGHAARGLLRALLNWDWRGAQEDMDRALALAPGDADTQRRHGLLLAMLGRADEAIAATRKAIEVDPLSPANWVNLSEYYMWTGRLGTARSALERALEISPDLADAHHAMPMLLLLEGQAARALPEIQRNPSEKVRLAGTAVAQHALGHATESQQALDALVAKYGDLSPTVIASVYAWRGELDRALEWFERAYARHDIDLARIREKETLSRSLRDDARYQALLRKMNFPPN